MKTFAVGIAILMCALVVIPGVATDATTGAIDVKVSGTVPSTKQPDTMACWSTAATMLKSWKDARSETIESVMDAADQNTSGAFGFKKLFTDNKGLSGNRKPDFLNALGLKAEGPQNFTIAGWASLLKNKGPLWVTTNEGTQQNFAVHARIMTAIAGDGSPEATFVTFIDPADGKNKSETVTYFTKKLEDIAKQDLGANADLRPQVVHY